jgi:hypothetical protein
MRGSPKKGRKSLGMGGVVHLCQPHPASCPTAPAGILNPLGSVKRCFADFSAFAAGAAIFFVFLNFQQTAHNGTFKWR